MSVPIPQQLDNIRLQLNDACAAHPLSPHPATVTERRLAVRIIALDVAVLSLIEIVEQLIGAAE